MAIPPDAHSTARRRDGGDRQHAGAQAPDDRAEAHAQAGAREVEQHHAAGRKRQPRIRPAGEEHERTPGDRGRGALGARASSAYGGGSSSRSSAFVSFPFPPSTRPTKAWVKMESPRIAGRFGIGTAWS